MTQASMLLAALTAQRRHVAAALEGLTDVQLRTPVPPTTWAPLAVMHHLALDVERWWFQAVVADDPRAWAYFDANPNGAWSIPGGIDVNALYETECAASDAIIAAADLESTATGWPDFLGPARTVGQIVLHAITETAAHAGHLDIVRETLDGRQHLVLD